VKYLLLDLATLECRLASLALAGGNDQLGAELLARASHLLGLRDASRGAAERLWQRR
jgi:hypothetical protein